MDYKKNIAPANQPSKNRVIKANPSTPAAIFNTKVLRALKDTLKRKPEADIASLLPSTYSNKLQSFKNPGNGPPQIQKDYC